MKFKLMRQEPAPEFLNGALKLMGVVILYTTLLGIAMIGAGLAFAEFYKAIT